MIYFLVFLWWFVGFLSSIWIWYMEECLSSSNRGYVYENVQFKLSSLCIVIFSGVAGPAALVFGIGAWLCKFGPKIVLYTFHKND